MPISATPESAALAPALDPPPWTLMIILWPSLIYSSTTSSANGWTEVDPAKVMEAGARVSSFAKGVLRPYVNIRITKNITTPKGMNRFSLIPPVHVNSMQ